MIADHDQTLDEALDTAAVAPPQPNSDQPGPGKGESSPSSAADEAMLDKALKDTFPTSDPPAMTQPGHNDPAPSSGYDEEAERAREQAGH